MVNEKYFLKNIFAVLPSPVWMLVLPGEVWRGLPRPGIWAGRPGGLEQRNLSEATYCVQFLEPAATTPISSRQPTQNTRPRLIM